MELQNFDRFGDDGEVWFGKDVQKKSVAYIMDQYCNENAGASSLSLLDVGTGNGALLFKLCKKGIYSRVQNVCLKGVDYSENSVMFSQRVRQSLSTREDVLANMRADYAKIEFDHQDAFTLVDEGRYDIIYDKGTFDVVYMNFELSNESYAQAMHYRLSTANPNAVFIITSCNCTSNELDEIFCS